MKSGIDVSDLDIPKIYFTSRTHSQLSQIVEELKKTVFYPSSDHKTTDEFKPVRFIPLGSRQKLCINQELRDRVHEDAEGVNDGCAEMQKGI